MSASCIGYELPRALETVCPVISQSSSKKGFWSWVGRKIGWGSTVDPKGSSLKLASAINLNQSMSKSPCHINQFPKEIFRIENTIDNLVSLQSTIHQMVYEFKFIHTDQIMTSGYVYEAVHAVLYQDEIQSGHSKPITLELRQEMYTEITNIIKGWLKTCVNPDQATLKLEAIINKFADLVWFLQPLTF